MSTPATAGPPPQPVYILRGHVAQIHSVAFLSGNTRLLTADADGWAVLWSLLSMRPVAVWRAHDSTVLAVAAWPGPPHPERRRVLTHGRDNKLLVWKLDTADESLLDTTLPIETAGHRRHPWVVASLDVNALNFCPFGMCPAAGGDESGDDDGDDSRWPDLLVAVPSALDSEAVDIMTLPTGTRAHANISHKDAVKTGMAMAVALSYSSNGRLLLVGGYESGHAIVYRHSPNDSGGSIWEVLYCHAAHSEPILSLTLSTAVTTITTDDSYFLTTSADEIIAQHPLEGTEPLQTVDTRRTGHQSVRLRGDGKLFATAGWDNRLRVYSAKTMNELAVLQWHRAGCYAIDFGEWLEGKEGEGSGRESGATGKGKGKGKEKELVGRLGDGGTVVTAAMARERKTRLRHWIAGGSKDSKVSLWEVY